MLQLLRKRLARSEEGFTLIELMVVVLIIAILLAIAIPTFLGARSRAQDRAAQSNLRNALTTEKTYYTDAQKYTVDDAAGGALSSIEPNLLFEVTNKLADQGITVTQADTSSVCLTRISASGTKFAIFESADQGTFYVKGTDYSTGKTACPAHDVSPAPGVQTGW
jgi:type IV pilus assembly protein PilA